MALTVQQAERLRVAFLLGYPEVTVWANSIRRAMSDQPKAPDTFALPEFPLATGDPKAVAEFLTKHPDGITRQDLIDVAANGMGRIAMLEKHQDKRQKLAKARALVDPSSGLAVLAAIIALMAAITVIIQPVWFKNFTTRSYSTCEKCHDSFGWKEYHTTPCYIKDEVGTVTGIFALCQDCWADMTPTQRLPYYHILMQRNRNWSEARIQTIEDAVLHENMKRPPSAPTPLIDVLAP